MGKKRRVVQASLFDTQTERPTWKDLPDDVREEVVLRLSKIMLDLMGREEGSKAKGENDEYWWIRKRSMIHGVVATDSCWASKEA